jgi:DNA-binding beta-propeller fold protein YncE
VVPTPSSVGASGTASGSATARPLEALLTIRGAPDRFIGDPNGLAVDAQGRIYVGENNPGGTVHVFDPQGQLLATWGGGQGQAPGQFDYITALAVDSLGNVYVADFNNTRVQKFDHDAQFLAQWATEAPAGPTGLALDQAGNAYVLNHRLHTHYIQQFNSGGVLVRAWGETGSESGQFAAGARSRPEQITTDMSNHVFATDPNNARLQEFDTNGTFRSSFGTEGHGDSQFSRGSGPIGVAVDNVGYVYASDFSDSEGAIQKFDASGRLLAKWKNVGQARLIVVDKDGDLYVADSNSRTIVKYGQQ